MESRVLPESLRPERLQLLELPDDTTLGEVRKFIMRSSMIAAIRAKSRYPDRVRFRVLDNAAGKEVPDHVTIGEVRQRIAAGDDVALAIDDGEGGALVPA